MGWVKIKGTGLRTAMVFLYSLCSFIVVTSAMQTKAPDEQTLTCRPAGISQGQRSWTRQLTVSFSPRRNAGTEMSRTVSQGSAATDLR